MAAGLLKLYAGERVRVTSAGSTPAPIFPGKRYLEWRLDDPAGKTREEIRVEPFQEPRSRHRITFQKTQTR